MGWGVVETWGYVVGRQICLNCCTSILPLVALCTNHNCIKKKKKKDFEIFFREDKA